MHNIRVLREKIGFSQQQVAESVNVSQQAVARWENGTHEPTLRMAKALAEALKCKIDDIL